jgi:hypothetical protein
LFGIARDFYGAALAHSAYLTWDSVLAGPFDVILWLLMFYGGFLLFRRLAPDRAEIATAK